MFVLSPVGPTFDLETKKKYFCRVSDYALSDSGNRFFLIWSLSYRTKTTFFRQAFQFNVGREILGATKQAKISPRSHFERPRANFGARLVSFSR